MIVVKTNLKKIPDTCNKCKFSFVNKYFDIRRCYLLNNKPCQKVKLDSGNLAYIRLPECPLISIDNNS